MGLITQGAKLYVETSVGGGVYAIFPGLREIQPYSASSPSIDVTNLDSTAREKQAGLIDYGTMDVTFDYDPTDTQQQGIVASMAAQEVLGFGVKFNTPTPQYMTFDGSWSNFSISGAQDDVFRVSASVLISGTPTFGTTEPATS